MSADTSRDTSSGQILVVTRNAIAEAMVTIAEVAGCTVVVLDADDPDGSPLDRIRASPPTAFDAVILADHDAPDTDTILRETLAGTAGYVAMMASRSRSQNLLATLRAEGLGEDVLERLRVPAGLDTGGQSPGEIALSVVAQVVAWSHGRTGGPMRRS